MHRACIGTTARAVIEAGAGHVLAVFNRSCYLTSDAGIACLGEDLAAGPLNLSVARDGVPQGISSMRVGSAWHSNGRRLSVANWGSVEWSCLPVWRAAPVGAWDVDALARGLAALDDVAGASVLAPGPAAASLDQAVGRLSRWLGERDGGAAEAQAVVVSLLGCGEGLTPSGDDLLAGVLIALRSFGCREDVALLGQVVLDHVQARTSAISAAHLGAACAGEGVEPVHALIRALAAGEAAAIEAATTRLRGHGASSGKAALRGIRTVARTLVQQCR